MRRITKGLQRIINLIVNRGKATAEFTIQPVGCIQTSFIAGRLCWPDDRAGVCLHRLKHLTTCLLL